MSSAPSPPLPTFLGNNLHCPLFHHLVSQVVNGPEVLSKYVGQAEENIRNLFAEAEAEYREKGDSSVSDKRAHSVKC